MDHGFYGIHRRQYRETSFTKKRSIYLDNEIPEVPIVTKDVDTEKDLVNINISGSSSPSGIAKYQYSLDNGETWNDLEKGKTLVLNEIGDYEF